MVDKDPKAFCLVLEHSIMRHLVPLRASENQILLEPSQKKAGEDEYLRLQLPENLKR